MKWRAIVLALFPISAIAFDLNPICHQYYELFKMPDLTYEDVGKLADKMHETNCWPAMQGLTSLDKPTPTNANELPSCRTLADHLISTTTNVRALVEVAPLTRSDCELPRSECNDKALSSSAHCRGGGPSVVPKASHTFQSRRTLREYHHVEYLTLSQCGLLINNPSQLAQQLPEFGFRPVNCRGKIVYSNGTKKGFYLYMEQYSDGNTVVLGENIAIWR